MVGENGRDRQEGHVDRHENNQDRALDGEGKHIARLREHRRIACDCRDDPRAADVFDRQQFRVPDLVHKADANLMDDRLDLGGRRDGDVGLGLDEQKERDDKK